MRRVASCTAGALCLWTLAGPSSALGAQGVVVDPESPAGQEYAIPLDDARRGAGEESSSGAPSVTEPAPAFGVGVDAATQDDGATTTTKPDKRKPRSADGEPQASSRSGASPGASLTSSTSGVTSDSMLWSAAAAALVLLVGLSAGLMARRYRHA